MTYQQNDWQSNQQTNVGACPLSISHLSPSHYKKHDFRCIFFNIHILYIYNPLHKSIFDVQSLPNFCLCLTKEYIQLHIFLVGSGRPDYKYPLRILTNRYSIHPRRVPGIPGSLLQWGR